MGGYADGNGETGLPDFGEAARVFFEEVGGITWEQEKVIMKYQLVLQWPANAIEDYDVIVNIENVLIECLSKKHEVDGHDAGSGEVNIFLRTDDPMAAFNEIKDAIGIRDFWPDARIAFREITGNQYTILWPADLFLFRVT